MKRNFNITNKNGAVKLCAFVATVLFFSFFSDLQLVAQTTGNAGAESIKVVGLVRDARTKLPLGAASVSVPNSDLSAVTNDNGVFTIQLVSRLSVLRVSAYDYNVREVGVQGKDTVVVDLYVDVFDGYFKKISTPTGQVENSNLAVSSKELSSFGKSGAVAVNEEFQQGLGADMRSVSRSGVSGVGSSLFVRGINSLNLNAQPLFVVDGVIWNNVYDLESIHEGFFSNPLDNVDLNDVESVTVLKDGASIYGSKGANGVILINTKHSKSMATKINLTVLHGLVEKPSSLPMMKSEEFRTYASDMFGSQGLSGSEVSAYNFLNTNTSNPIYNTYHNSVNWADLVYQQSIHKSYSINATGGDEKAMYYFSLGYTGNDELVKSTDFQRINTRFNADFNLAERLKLALNIGFSRNERNLLDDGVNNYTSPTWIRMLKAPFLSPYKFTSKGQLTRDVADTDEFNVGNPMGIIEYAVNNLKKYRLNIGVLPTFQITPELSVSSQFDYSVEKNVEGHFDPYGPTPVRVLEGYGLSYNRSSSQVARNASIYDDTRLVFKKAIDKQNHISAIAGWRYIINTLESDYVEEHNSKSNSKPTITGNYEFLQAYGVSNQTKSISNYATTAYNYGNRLFVDATVALDGSSRFGNNTQGGFQMFGYSWGVFPSVNAAWVVSAENFMRDLPAISYMKLRAGYGVTGNDGIQDYESMAYFAAVQLMSRANGIVLENIANNKIQWETTARANVGADVSLFNDRTSLSFDYFSSKTDDLLTMKDLPDETGLGKYWANGGTMTNNGFEASLSVKTLNLKNLKWELGASVGHYKNKITSLPNGDYTTDVFGGQVLTSVGNAANVFYGYKTAGVFSTSAEAEAANLKVKNSDGTYSAFAAGDMRFVEKQGAVDGVIDDKDRQIIGDPNPDFYGTINSKLAYKRLTLNTVFTYSVGNDVYNYYRSQLEAGKDLSNQTSAMNSRWTADGQLTNQPKAVYGDPMGNARFSDRWIEDGSYLKLKTVSLAYDLPLKSKYMQGLSLWVSANNLVTFTKYLGIDPEFSAKNSVSNQGIDTGLIPLTRSYFVGINFRL